MIDKILCPCCDSLFEIEITSMQYGVGKKILIDKSKNPQKPIISDSSIIDPDTRSMA